MRAPAAKGPRVPTVRAAAAVIRLSNAVLPSVLLVTNAALEIAAAAMRAPAAKGPRVRTVRAAAAVTRQSNVVRPSVLLVLG